MEFRFANEEDCGLILSFIRQLAAYEKMSDQVVATEDLLREWIFEKKKTEGQAFTWRICLSFRNTEEKDMGKHC